MTNNTKMREVWDAHDKARNKAWREDPGTFDTLDAFKAGAAWQAAQSPAVPVMGSPVAWTSPEWLKEKGKLHGMTLTELIADSAFAATFQTMGQYRMALIAAAKEHDARQEGIVRAVVLAYKEGRNGEPYHPGYTPHEAVAWQIGQAEAEKVKKP